MDRKTDSPAEVLKKLFNDPILYANPVKEKDYTPRSKPAAENSAGKNTGAAGFNIERYVKENFNMQKKSTPVGTPAAEKPIVTPRKEPTLDLRVTQRHLQEAVIWSEIIGKPVCKRHRGWGRPQS